MSKIQYVLSSVWLIIITFFSASTYSQIENKVPKSLMKNFSFEMGSGSFKQSKSFKFMSVPIVSHGRFIVDGKRVLWQTTSPIKSEILLTDTAVYKRSSTNKTFKLLVKESPINRMITAVLTGNFNDRDWLLSVAESADFSNSCLKMLPKSPQLVAVFTSATLCNQANNQRQVLLVDKQNNKTLIEMNISKEQLTPEDKLSLEHP